MVRIGARLSGTERMLLNNLSDAQAASTLNMLRIANETNILTPSSDPSVFTALSGFQSRLTDVTATMTNVTAADSMISQAQTALDGIRTQLEAIRTELVTDEDQELTSEERTASQAAIDAAILEINSLAATSIDGARLLDGSATFDVSGRNSSQVTEVLVHSMPGDGDVTTTISGSVTQAATRAELVYTGSGGAVDAGDTAVLTVTGETGSASVSVIGSESLDDLATRINNVSHETGVTASVSGSELTFSSVDLGSDATIEIVVASGSFTVTGGNEDGTAEGTDAEATIVGSNGVMSTDNVDGNRFTIARNGVHYEIEFAEDFTGSFDTISLSGDAMTFALSGDVSHRSTLAIQGVQAAALGGVSGSLTDLYTGGSAAGLDSNTSQAIRIVDEALADLTKIEGAVDGFHSAAITTASSLLSDIEDELNDAIDETDGYNETEQSLLLTKNDRMASNTIAGLSILDDQRQSIVNLLLSAAGLL